MRGLCVTSTFTSGSGSFPPVTNTNSDANVEKIGKRIIFDGRWLNHSRIRREAHRSFSLKRCTWDMYMAETPNTWQPTSATHAPPVRLFALLPLRLVEFIYNPRPSPYTRIQLVISRVNYHKPHPRWLNPSDVNRRDVIILSLGGSELHSLKSLRSFICVAEM